jgi:phenylalanyl-tRNA synthetase beta chain
MNEKREECRQYASIPVFPEVTRDIAFVVPQAVQHDMLVDELQEADDLITKVVLFDVFAGAHVKPGYKSMAYHVTYAKPDRTLTSSEVDAAEAKVFAILKNKFQAELRK